MRTQVGVIGAGPAGLLLASLLARQGIESVILERRSADYVLGRVRAGVLEQGTVALLERAHCADRMHRDGIVHHGFTMLVDGVPLRIDLSTLAGGTVMVYGQTEVTRDLMAQRSNDGGTTLYRAEITSVRDLDGDRPQITFRQGGRE